MSSVWYVGRANTRIISAAWWATLGVGTVPDTIWNAQNGYSIPSSSFNAGQITILAQYDEFNTAAPDGPRTTPVAPTDTFVTASTLATTITNLRLPSTYKTKDIAPTTAVTANEYNAADFTYNRKPAQSQRVRALMGAALAGARNFRMAFVGHSLIMGAFATPGITDWPHQLAGMLQRAGYTITGEFISAYKNAVDARVTVGAGWAGIGGGFTVQNNQTNSNPLLFTSTTPSTSVDVYYLPSNGPFTVSIDGAAAVSIPTSSATVMAVYTVTGLTLSSARTVSIVRTSGSVYIAGVDFSIATKGVRIANLGVGGAYAADLAIANAYTQASFPTNSAYVADIVFLQCTFNDARDLVAASVFKTNYQTAITTLKSAGAQVVLITDNPNNFGGGSGVNVVPYIQALYELADSNDLTLIDTSAALGTYAQANANGLMYTDAVHMVANGYATQARAIHNGLKL